MLVTCQSCSTKFNIPDAKIAGKRARMKCKKCGESISIDGRHLGEAGVVAAPEPAEPEPAPPVGRESQPSFSEETKVIDAAQNAALSRQATPSEPELPPGPAPAAPSQAPAIKEAAASEVKSSFFDDTDVDDAMSLFDTNVFSAAPEADPAASAPEAIPGAPGTPADLSRPAPAAAAQPEPAAAPLTTSSAPPPPRRSSAPPRRSSAPPAGASTPPPPPSRRPSERAPERLSTDDVFGAPSPTAASAFEADSVPPPSPNGSPTLPDDGRMEELAASLHPNAGAASAPPAPPVPEASPVAPLDPQPAVDDLADLEQPKSSKAGLIVVLLLLALGGAAAAVYFLRPDLIQPYLGK